jgi:hypothetical protein
MTITEPSQYPDKDPSQSAWEKQVTEATNRIQHQVDNINESVNVPQNLIAVYSKTQDGAVQQFTPFADGDGFVAYVAYTDILPALPVSGQTFSPYSDEEINVIIKQYRESATRPTNPGTTSYQVTGGVWNSSPNWTKQKLDRAGVNVWFCEARIIGQAGQTVTAKWSNAKLLYGGAVASGILYYNVAATDANKPSAPSVDTSGTATGAVIDGYDYDSGVFSLGNNAALSTLGWQYTPISVAVGGADSISKKHWQVLFHVETSEVDNTQIITFGTVTGFIPIGSVLQSDNYSAGSAGWQIQRTGDADFNNVNIRGNSTVQGSVLVNGTVAANKISASNLSAISADLGTITAGTINGGTINAGSVTVSGGFTAPQLAVGVILQIVHGSYGGSGQGGGSGTVATLTATNNPNFNTKLIMIANCQGSSGAREGSQGNFQESTFSTSIQVSGSGITTTGASCGSNQSNQERSASKTLVTGSLTKGATYTLTSAVSGNFTYSASGDAILMEVKI